MGDVPKTKQVGGDVNLRLVLMHSCVGGGGWASRKCAKLMADSVWECKVEARQRKNSYRQRHVQLPLCVCVCVWIRVILH